MFKGFGLLLAATLISVGCGGTSSGTIGNGGGDQNYSGQAQGLYFGTMSNGYPFEIIILPNDKFYEIYGTLVGNLYSISGMVSGQGISGNGTYSANSVTELLYTDQTFVDNLTASDVAGSSVGGTLIEAGKVSGTSFNGTSPPASSFDYNTPASLGDISGAWTGVLLDGRSTTVTISTSGTVNGSASGCPLSGTFVADPSNKNFFDVSLTFGGVACAFPTQTSSGIAVDSLLADGVTHQLMIVVSQGVSAGTAFLAQRSPGGGIGGTDALNGQYAFSLAGFDSTGNPMSMAGSMKADGLGHITAGELDLNDNGTISSSASLTGTYAFDPNVPLIGGYTFNSNSQGVLGTIALTYTVGTVSHPLAFGFSLQGGGGFGQIMSLDANNFVASGTMQQQSSSALTLSSLAGDYIVTLNGTSAGNPTSALGHFTLASDGTTSNVVFDRSVAGVGSAGPTMGGSATVGFGSAGPDASGRGTLTVTVNDGLASTTQNFTYYAVSAQRIIAIEADGNGTMTADFSGQGTPFSAGTVVTSGSVFAMAGLDTAASNEIAAVGQLQITGVGANAGTLRWDSNDAGVIVGPTVFASQAVPVFDPSTGRGTVTIANGAVNGLADSVVFYLSAPGTGFIMDTTAGVFNRAMVGTLTAQAGGPYLAATDLAGLGIVRTRGWSVNDALSLVGLFGLTTTPGKYAILFDQRFPKNGIVQTQVDQSSAGMMVQALDEVTGRGTLTLPNGGSTATEVFYMVGPEQFVFIDISLSSGLNGPSSVFYVNAH